MTQTLRVLMIEDSEDDALLLARELKRGGLDFAFERVDSANAVHEAVVSRPWELILCDYSMPHLKGTDALRLVRETGLDIPFIFVSGTIQEDTAVEAMRSGAQDYLMKGNLKRLIPAITRELGEVEVRRKRAQAEKALQLKELRIRALHEINLAITSTLDLTAILQMLLEKIALLLPYSAATIELANKTGVLEPIACQNLEHKEWLDRSSTAANNPANIVRVNRAPVIIQDMQTDPRVQEHEFYVNQGFFSYMGTPLTAKGKFLGVLGFYTKTVHEFTDDEVNFLETLGGQVAVAIHNSQLFETVNAQAAELDQANEVKSEFLSVISHELRTPINVMMGYVELVQQGLLGEIKPQQNDALKKSLDHSRNLLGLVSDILQATRIQSRDVKLDSATVSFKELLEKLRLRYEPCLKTNLTLTWVVPAELPHIETDANKINHILQSLLDNAIKFTDAGTIRISAQVIAETDQLELQVADSGPGIAAEKIPLIFDLFRQVDGSSKRSHDGLGLGLFLVKKHTELLGGELRVISELGKGSTFTVLLPIHRNFHTT